MRVIVAGRLSRKVADRDQTGFDSQEREAVAWAEREGHDVVAAVADYAKGPSDLTARKNLRPWVTESPKLEQWDALVCLKVDRLTRADKQGTNRLEKWAHDHGKQIMVATAGVHFPAEGNDGIAWDIYLRQAHAEYLAIRERYVRMQRTLHAKGSAVGRAPWGFTIESAGDRKVYVPTALGRQWIPAVYQWGIDGMSGPQIARRLTEAGVPTMTNGGKHPWHETYVLRLLANPVYYGKRRGAVKGSVVTEALVSENTFNAAGSAISSRGRLGRSATVNAKPMVQALCWACYGQERDGCANGRSVMYRVYTGSAGSRRAYYRCSGSGPQRMGCGAPMIPCELLDSAVVDAMAGDARPDFEQVQVAQDVSDTAARIRELRADADAAEDAGEYERADSLRAEARRLREAPAARRWALRETGLTIGQAFAAKAADERREYLSRYTVLAQRNPEARAAEVTADGWIRSGTAAHDGVVVAISRDAEAAWDEMREAGAVMSGPVVSVAIG